ncbi:efflux RND transporter periplasmic adaptor subunit [Bradyrhizobium sp. LHD-71]|uniref:efflux RND transporter periplasmic adaptor subunit n=1 Tax=Bradyrhizobium sp. LHD-71 TaxID=3072141 RepID=UPI00280D51E2|nr:efflux RND transporter periplasmic adaptor subunit [Bradyrhizobium sp. LHD-71]MDQ8727166.1 efflux RND transporter periplasmic adaptor subunit [Bradyrhizobium sp. LHD-71]
MRARSAMVVLALVSAPLVLAGCDERSVAATQTSVPDVSVITIAAAPKSIVRELPGRIAPTRVADVRARVSGIVTARLFEQGSEVKAGDALYQIDPKPFEVDLQSAEAALAKAEAVFEQTSLQSKRTAALIAKQAASVAENEAAIATARQAAADVAARKADVARAKLNLEYATVRAPISGVIGAALVSEGALVVQNDTTSMATIQQLDTVYADFTQSAAELGRLRRDLESGALQRIAPDAVKVSLMLDEGAHPVEGRLLFSDRKVDTHTGQVTLRGEFKNPKRELLPGMYVRVQIEQGIDNDAILVPLQAIQRNGGGTSEVYVLNAENRAVLRPVRVGTEIDGQSLILDGLKQGDRVVVEGFQKFAAGDPVAPVPWQQRVAAAPSDAPTTQLR